MIGRRSTLLAVGSVLVLAACGGGSSEPDAASDTTAAVAAAPTAPAIEPATGSAAAVPAALDFSAPLVGGGEIEMGQFAGRPVLLWFWAPW